jgi:oligosaccharide repeat unit polymerase
MSIKNIIMMLLSLILIIAAFLFSISEIYLAASACLILVIALVPLFFRKNIDYFSSWNFLLYSIVIGVFFRAIYISFELSKPDVISSLFLKGESIDILFWPSILMVVGILFFMLGYLMPKYKLPISHLKFASEKPEWNPRKYRFISVSLLIISLVAFFLFVRANGIDLLLLDGISKHRGLNSELSEYRSYSYLRMLISLSDIVLFISYVKINQSIKVELFDVFLFLFSIMISISFYIIVSSRGGAVLLIISLIALNYYLNAQKFKFKVYFPLMLTGLSLMYFLTVLRKASAIDIEKSLSESFLSLLDPFIFALNLIDVSKTAHIIRAIPGKLDYEFGGTYLPILYSWIPRDFWPDKPIVNIDNIIGFQVYDASVLGSGGVPPGLFAEAFWNFSYGGVIVVAIVAGVVLRIIANTFRKANINNMIIHVSCFMFLGISMLGSSFSSTVIGVLIKFFPLILVLTFITSRSKQGCSKIK